MVLWCKDLVSLFYKTGRLFLWLCEHFKSANSWPTKMINCSLSIK